MLGAIIGGGWGQVISQGSQFGLGTAFLRFSREYEQQADLLGAQIMARAGYDPRDMANMFKTIEKAGRLRRAAVAERSPEPGQSRRLHHQGSRSRCGSRTRSATRAAFTQVQARLKQMPPAPTTEQATKNAGNRPTGTSR